MKTLFCSPSDLRFCCSSLPVGVTPGVWVRLLHAFDQCPPSVLTEGAGRAGGRGGEESSVRRLRD